MYKAPNGKKYLEQWERVKRWYEKVLIIKKGTVGIPDDDLLDQVYAFFINCYHLKDWIGHSVLTLKNELDNIFNKNSGILCFRLCEDICNGSKHFEITSPKIDRGTKITTKSVRLLVPVLSFNNEENKNKFVVAQYSWEVESGGQKYDVFGLADDCVKEWEIFFVTFVNIARSN